MARDSTGSCPEADSRARRVEPAPRRGPTQPRVPSQNKVFPRVFLSGVLEAYRSRPRWHATRDAVFASGPARTTNPRHWRASGQGLTFGMRTSGRGYVKDRR